MNRQSCTHGAPAVSVIMPAYNAARTLAWAIDTVRSQTFRNWELIIVDDGSVDQTAEIAGRYRGLDPRIKLTKGRHEGVSAARNAGIHASQGAFVAFLDADDGWHPDKLTCHLRHLANKPGVGVSFSQAAILDEQGRPTGQVSRGRTRALNTAHLLYSNPTTTTSTLVVRREVFDTVGLFNHTMSFAEDLEWLIRASALSGYRLEGLDQPLTLYRTSSEGLSSQLDRMQGGWERLIEEARACAPGLVRKHYGRARADHLYYLARRALRLHGQGERALGFLQEALASDRRLVFRRPARVLAVYVLARLARAGRRSSLNHTTPRRT